MKVKEYLQEEKIYTSDNLIKKPIISIILPTYCRGDNGLLQRAIDSVINQTFKEWELIIVDDGSIDSTRKVVEDLLKKDERIVYIRNEQNSGLPAIRVNQGILHSRGRYIAYQFDDDRWYDHMLDTMYNKIIQLDNLAMVYGKGRFCNFVNKRECVKGEPYTEEKMKKGNVMLNNTVLHSRELPFLYGGYDCHISMRRLCDMDLWKRWGKVINLTFIDEVISIVEFCHSDSIGLNANKNDAIVEERYKLDRSKMLSLYNIGEYEIDNLDIVSDKEIQKLILETDVIPWKKQRDLQ